MKAQKIYMKQHRASIPYNFCYYAYNNVCDGSSCLLEKCYHDMTQAEFNHFKEIWKRLKRK